MRGESRRSTSAASRPSVSSSMSANTGRAPTRRTALAVETNVNEGQMTSCPGPMPRASRASSSACVQEVVRRTRGATSSSEARLNALGEGAVAGQPARERPPHGLRLGGVEPGLAKRDGARGHGGRLWHQWASPPRDPGAPRRDPRRGVLEFRAVRRLIALLAAQKDDLSFFALASGPAAGRQRPGGEVAGHAARLSRRSPRRLPPALRRASSRGTSACSRSRPSSILLSRRGFALRPACARCCSPSSISLFAVLTVFHFVNAGFFMFFGAPLTRDLMLLALPLMAYVTKVGAPGRPRCCGSALVAVLAPLVLTPILWRALRPGIVAAERRLAPGRTWIVVAGSRGVGGGDRLHARGPLPRGVAAAASRCSRS